jgi:hypothetical protein
MKVPPHQYEATVIFYRDVIGLMPITTHAPAVGFVFGDKQLWIDRVAALSQAEIWLEVVTNDTAEAKEHLVAAGAVRCDEIEPLPEGFDGFWISNPASIVHMVSNTDKPW